MLCLGCVVLYIWELSTHTKDVIETNCRYYVYCINVHRQSIWTWLSYANHSENRYYRLKLSYKFNIYCKEFQRQNLSAIRCWWQAMRVCSTPSFLEFIVGRSTWNKWLPLWADCLVLHIKSILSCENIKINYAHYFIEVDIFNALTMSPECNVFEFINIYFVV